MFSTFKFRSGFGRPFFATVVLVTLALGIFGLTNANAGGRLLMVSESPNRTDYKPVYGSTLSGNVYIFVQAVPGTTQIVFHIDSPTATPVSTENIAPWDLATTAGDGTARPFNVNTLKPGKHGIYYQMFFQGKSLVNYASFTVVAPGTTKPTTTTSTTAPVIAPPVTQPSSGSILGLDESGKTIPDTNYSAPANAIYMATNGSDTNNGSKAAPVKTLNQAIALVPSGGTIVVNGGTYRDFYGDAASGSPKINTKPLTIQAAPHAQVWFDGTDVVSSGWSASGNGDYSVQWNTPQFCNGKYYQYAYGAQASDNTGPCSHKDVNGDGVNAAAADPQIVYVDGKELHEVASASAVTSSTFFYDESVAAKSGRIVIGMNPSGHTVELAKRPSALISGAKTQIKGIGFKRFASNEYSNITVAAVYASGYGSSVVDSVFTLNAGEGLYVTSVGGLASHDVLVANGFDGMGSNGHGGSGGATDGIVIDSNVFNDNNTEHFDSHCGLSCGNAGIKIAHMDGFTFSNNLVENNDGAGEWCDTQCINGVMINNVVRNNTQDGLFYEASVDGIIASNVTINNGKAGIRVASENVKVYNNTVANNTGSYQIWVYDPTITPQFQVAHAANIDIKNNVIAGSSPILLYASSNVTGPSTFFSGLDYNTYVHTSGTTVRFLQGVGTNWGTLTAFNQATGFEAHGREIDASTASVTNASSFVVTSAGSSGGTTLPADVASALKVSASAGQTKGAITWVGKN